MNKKSLTRILWGVITLVMLAAITSACSFDIMDVPEAPTPTKAPVSSTDATKYAEPTEAISTEETSAKENRDAYGVGDTAQVKNVIVSLLSVTESTGSSFNTPSDGNVFVLCEFEIQNNTKEELAVSSMLSFNAYCDDYTCNYSLRALMEKGNSNQLDGTVAVGKKLKGVIGYEVPTDWKELEIHFTPDVWFGKDFVFIATNE